MRNSESVRRLILIFPNILSNKQSKGRHTHVSPTKIPLAGWSSSHCSPETTVNNAEQQPNLLLIKLLPSLWLVVTRNNFIVFTNYLFMLQLVAKMLRHSDKKMAFLT